MNTRDVSTVEPFFFRPIMRLYADVPTDAQKPTRGAGAEIW